MQSFAFALSSRSIPWVLSTSTLPLNWSYCSMPVDYTQPEPTSVNQTVFATNNCCPYYLLFFCLGNGVGLGCHAWKIDSTKCWGFGYICNQNFFHLWVLNKSNIIVPNNLSIVITFLPHFGWYLVDTYAPMITFLPHFGWYLVDSYAPMLWKKCKNCILILMLY